MSLGEQGEPCREPRAPTLVSPREATLMSGAQEAPAVSSSASSSSSLAGTVCFIHHPLAAVCREGHLAPVFKDPGLDGVCGHVS